MTTTPKTIAVVQGAPGADVQAVFRTLVERWRHSARIVGVIAEHHTLANRACSAGFLRSIRTNKVFPIFQDLGPAATACHLDASGIVTAAASVRGDIEAGCDLAVLSKFGKLESMNSGLLDAFIAAFDAHVPVLTSIAPAFETAWRQFADPLFVYLPADPVAIDAWWRSVRPPPPVIDKSLRTAIARASRQ